MENFLVTIALLMVAAPLAGALLAGLFGKYIGKLWSHRILISLVGLSFCLALYLFNIIVINNYPAIDHTFYTWADAGSLNFNIGFLIDRLSATMLVVVLFVSLMVHIYTIGYMEEDPGYQRFFSYVSLFTFAMLVLVLADNFLLLFFGWEGVGLVSYLLIGFWFEREAAVNGGLKAFLANRVGDFGFILAIAGILYYFHTINYHDVFQNSASLIGQTMELIPGHAVSVATVICSLLFVGAMGKSAQVPLHVWLPESMEGPTPISALIHAATMVTAGIYMVARTSPLFELATPVLSFILVIGGTTALFMGFLAVTQFDIKRVIAYSTLSQLGYMAVALGASAYDAAIFHLMTHAFFKALLFLCAGSVIIALHHEQDMRKMGKLASALPVTYITFLIGTLALCAFPPFSGFFSKDTIIEAVHLSTISGAHYAYTCVLVSAFVTPLYMFRALFMTFHTNDRTSPEVRSHIHESPWVVLLPLVLLAVPSIIVGGIFIGPMLYNNPTILADTIFVLPEHNVMHILGEEFKGATMMALQAGTSPTLWFSLAGMVAAWLFIVKFPAWSEMLKRRFAWVYFIMQHKYGFDDFNRVVLVKGTKDLGNAFYHVSDQFVIDDVVVDGSGHAVRRFAEIARRMQTGYIYHYALAMVLGLLFFLVWYVGA